MTAEPRPLTDRDRETLERIAAAQDEDTIERALTAARERLHMDAAYLSAVDSRRQLVTELYGDTGAVGLSPGHEIPVEQSYCSRMLKGELPNVVPDTSEEPAVRGLRATARIGAYVGVPITLADGSVHGTLCCASRQPRQELGEQELTFMRVLAGMVATRIDRSRGDRPAG